MIKIRVCEVAGWNLGAEAGYAYYLLSIQENSSACIFNCPLLSSLQFVCDNSTMQSYVAAGKPRSIVLTLLAFIPSVNQSFV